MLLLAHRKVCMSCRMGGWGTTPHVWIRHVTLWLPAYLSLLARRKVCMSCHMYKWVMLYLWMSHVTTCVNKSCHVTLWLPAYSLTCHCLLVARCVCHVTCMHESCHVYAWVMSHEWMSHVTTCVNESSQTLAMGWLRLVSSFKLQVSFAKDPYRRDDILQKETYHFKEPTDRSHPIPAYCFTSPFISVTCLSQIDKNILEELRKLHFMYMMWLTYVVTHVAFFRS